MDTIWPGIITGIVVGIVVAVATQTLGHLFQYRRGVMEKRLDLYLELMSRASDDLFRAKQMEAAFALKQPQETPEYWQQWASMEEQRHNNRRDIARIVSKLQLVEPEKDLREKLKALPKIQPFLMSRSWESPVAQKNFELHTAEIQRFAAELSDIADAVLKQHAWLEAFAGMVQENRR